MESGVESESLPAEVLGMSFDKTEFKIILGGIGAILLVAVIGISLEPQPSPEPQLQKAANPVPQHESALRRISVGMIQEDDKANL